MMNLLEKWQNKLHTKPGRWPLFGGMTVPFKKTQKKLSFCELQDIVAQVTYLDWKLVVELDKAAKGKVSDDHRRPYLQVLGHGPDPQNGKIGRVHV